MFRWSFAGYFFFGYCCVAVLGASPLISSVCCRARQNASPSLCLATHGRTPSTCCRTVSTFGRASPVLPRSSTWFNVPQRTPWCRARGSTPHRLQRASALNGAARGRTLVSSPVLPRSMVPRAAVRLIVVNVLPHSFYVRPRISCAAAQFNVLPRSMVTRAAERSCLRLGCRAVQRTAALHGAARAAVRLIVFNVRPRSMVPRTAERSCLRLCCRAVVWIAIKGRLIQQSEVSRSAALVEVSQSLGSRREGWSSSDSQSFSD